MNNLLPVLYRNDSSWIRKVKLMLIGQYQAAAVSPNGARNSARLPAAITTGGGALTWAATIGSHTEWSLYELYLEKDHARRQVQGRPS